MLPTRGPAASVQTVVVRRSTSEASTLAPTATRASGQTTSHEMPRMNMAPATGRQTEACGDHLRRRPAGDRKPTLPLQPPPESLMEEGGAG
jgi:5-hydroxyisourate hydrolase-like protein (transthyretin family)